VGPGERLLELVAYRGLIQSLTARELRLKYRRSALGAVWSLLNPLLMMAVYVLIFGVFLKIFTLPEYWAYLLTGLIAWLFFANALGTSVTTLVQNPNLVTKIYFPLEALPIAGALANFVNFCISMALLALAVIVAGRPVGPSLVLLPIVMVAQLGFSVGLAVLLSALTVYLRDIEHLVGIFLTGLFYVTPVLYPLSRAGRYARYLRLNPMTWIIECYHSILYFGTWPDPRLFALTLLAAAVSLVGGYLVFLRLRPRLPEEL